MQAHKTGRLAPIHKYVKAFEMGFQIALEYRLNFLISLISAAYPIFIQTYLWTAIYGGSAESVIYGFTYRQIIAYTFLAGLVTRIVRTGFEYNIMEDVKNGKFSTFLVQPLGYFPYRLCSYFGQKLPGQAMILVILVVVLVALNVFWGVTFAPLRILAFIATLIMATVLNFLIFYIFSAMAFWIVEVGFLFEGIRIVTILLSGGIFPLEVFGEHFLSIMNLLPFRYTVHYPITVLNGTITTGEAVNGLLMQLLWIGICLVISNVVWRVGSRRYVAVGG